MSKKMRRIKLMADYDCWPLWEAGDNVGNIDPSSLPISEELHNRLLAWAEVYNKTLAPSYPPESGSKSPKEEEIFEQEGLSVRASLAKELGVDYKIIYFSAQKKQILDINDDENGV
jgi:hypothetical protein